MILLLTNDGDMSCDLVIDWLNYYNHPYKRLNSFDFLNNDFSIIIEDNGSLSLKIGEEKIDLNIFNAIWYRKYGFFRDSDNYARLINSKQTGEKECNHLVKEYQRTIDFILYVLKEKRWLTNPFHANMNKLDMLRIANNCGLNIPKTKVVNSIRFLKDYQNLICKSVYDSTIASWGENNKCMMYTTGITSEDMKNIPHRFLPSIIQERIEKAYELRIFYLCGECFSMAIFSQGNKKTSIDFRNYDWDKPNRFVPYKLDRDTENKLENLMDQLGLNCGSIDLIKGRDGKLYFLEVNPTGQFGMVDFPCNYGLHKRVAEKLIEMDVN